MFSSTKRLIFILIMGAAVLNSCVKDITDDIDDLQTADDIQNWIFPFINSDIQLEDLDSNNIKVYPDGTVYYTTDSDSAIVVDANNIFTLSPIQQVDNQEFFFNGVNTLPYDETKVSTLQSILGTGDPGLWATLSPLNGTASPVPPFAASNLGTQILPAFTTFDYITYDNGNLDVTISNGSNIPLSNIALRFTNVLGGNLGTVLFPTLAAGGSETVQLNMAGRTIRSLVQYEILTLESPGIASPGIVDFGSPLAVELSSTDNMVVNTARSEFNSPIFDFSFFYELKDENGNPLDEEITEIEFKSGRLLFLITTNLTSSVILEGQIEGSAPLATISNEFAGLIPDSRNDTIELAGRRFDLTLDPFNPFNRIPIKFSPRHYFAGLNNFNKNDRITVTVLAQDIEFKEVIGRFGVDSLNIPLHTIDWKDNDILGNISGNVQVQGAKLNFHTRTNIGADYSADLNGAVTDINGNLLPAEFNQELTFTGPAVPQFGTTTTDVFTYDQSNSNADDIVSFLPNTMTTAGTFHINKNNPNRMCYLNDEAFMQIDLEMEMPLNLIADTLFFIDTVRYENEDFDDLRDIDTAKFVNSMFLHMYIQNDFPVNIGTTLSIVDSVDETTDSLLTVIDYGTVIDGAKVDAAGETIESTIYKHVIELTKEERIALVNGDKILVDVRLLTSKFNSTAPFVKLKADDHFKLNLSVEVQNHIPVE